MLADFIITIEDARKPLAVRVVVHENLRALRSAATKWDNKGQNIKKRKYGEFHDTLGLCQRFHMMNDPLCAIVRLAPPHLGAGIIAHEMGHAAVHIREIEYKYETPPLCSDNDERFCWILGALVRQAVDTMYKYGVYD